MVVSYSVSVVHPREYTSSATCFSRSPMRASSDLSSLVFLVHEPIAYFSRAAATAYEWNSDFASLIFDLIFRHVPSRTVSSA